MPGSGSGSGVTCQRWSALHYPSPPRSVLVIKKHNDAHITREVLELCRWLRDERKLRVFVEPNARADTPAPAPAPAPPLTLTAAAGTSTAVAAANDSLAEFEPFPISTASACHPSVATPTATATATAAAASASKALTATTTCGNGPSAVMAASTPKLPVDFCITVGGDGTLLYLNSLFNDSGPVPPVLSFARGSLGFLTHYDFRQYKTILTHVLRCMALPPSPVLSAPVASPHGQVSSKLTLPHSTVTAATSALTAKSTAAAATDPNPLWLCMRMRLLCSLFRKGETKPADCHQVMNEVLVSRGTSPALTTLELYVDSELVTVVQADGLIISTPTGSTAYSMSAGGSMMAPSVAAILVTPICPHTLSFRPLILPDTSTLQVRLPEHSEHSAFVSFDGRAATKLEIGDCVTISASAWPLPSISIEPINSAWFKSIKQKLSWNARKPQQRTKATPPATATAAGATPPAAPRAISKL